MFRHLPVYLLLAALPLAAQEFRATMSGRITDPSGAAVGGAKIEARSAATASLATAESAGDGSYTIPFLTPGAYTVTVEKTGFRRLVREGIQLQVSERAVVDISLTIGDTSQSVTVNADSAVIETETADRGLVVESKRIENVPLQGRNIFAQAWSAPGVTLDAAVARLRPFDIAGSSSMAISGGQPSMNEVLIDGVSNLAGARSVAYVPPVEATAEFKVQTSAYDAQYGWTTGGVVNVVTKGGSNRFHGSAFEFLQNTLLNANTFDNNRNRIPRSSSHINTFGGDFSGPVKKDKLFFLFSYENIRQVIPDPFVTSVPTAAQRSGDFSQTYFARDANGVLQQQVIFDPLSTAAGSGGAFVRTPFPGNRIPADRINPVARGVLQLIPEGNVPGNAVTALGNLVSTGSTRKFTDFFPEYSGRVDWNISNRTRFFTRYSRNALAEERGFRYSTTSKLNLAETSGNTPFRRENHSATMQLTHSLSANTVLDFRAGLARFLGVSGNSIGNGFNPSQLGFAPQFVSQVVPYFPRFNWANYEGAGSNPVQFAPSQTNSFQASASSVRGRHNLKSGVEFRLQRTYNSNPGFWAGNFSFDQQFTSRDPLRVEPGSGNSIASFLLGTPQSGFVDINTAPAHQQRLWSVYLQDDIRVTSRLKLSAGLRWDYLGPMTDRFNAVTRGFDTASPSPLQVSGLTLKGGLLFAAQNGRDRGIYDKDWNNFGPRAGFAYQLGDKMVLRGGYGLVYAQTFDDPGVAPGYSQRTDMVTSIRTGLPENLLTNPFPAPLQRPVGNSLGLGTFLGLGFDFADTTRVQPWTHQFSFEVQRELPGQILLSASYVGSRTRALAVTQQFNEIPLDALNLGAAALTQNVANPMAGRVPGTFLNGATVQRQQLLRPYPQFNTIRRLFRPVGESRYDSFQLFLYKRMSSGLNLSMAYTHSRTMERLNYANPQDSQPERVISRRDIPNNLQLNGLYELPFGTGKRFLASAPRAVRPLVSGWEISGIARIQQGMPIEFAPIGGVPTGRNPVLANQTRDRWFNTCTQLPNGTTRGCVGGEEPVWTIRQPFTLQTWSSRFASLRRPGIFNLDAAVLKNTKIGEAVNLVFRADFLNATNGVQFFDGPEMNINSGNFGRIAGARTQSNLPRFIQLSLKLKF